MDYNTLNAALKKLVEQARAQRQGVGDSLRAARHLTAAQRSDLAEQLYRELVSRYPRDSRILRELGMLLRDHGGFEEAFDLFVRALAGSPDEAMLHHDVGGLLAAGYGDPSRYLAVFWPMGEVPGTLETAEQIASQQVGATPTQVRLRVALGHVLLARHRVSAAVNVYRAVAEREPDLGRTCLITTLQLAGREGEADVERGLQWMSQGDAGKAAAALRRGLRSGGRSSQAYLNLVRALQAQGAYEAAIAACREGLRWYPDEVELRREWLWSLSSDGRLGEAKDRARTFGTVRQDGFFDWIEHLSLPVVYASEDEVRAARASFGAGLRHIEERVEVDTPEVLTRWKDVVRGVNFYLPYQGELDKEFQVRYASVVRDVTTALVPDLAPHSRTQARERVRVGFASPYWHRHTVSKLFSGWVTERDETRVEAFVYKLGGRRDAMEGAIRASADVFRHFRFKDFLEDLSEVAEQIVSDALNILIYPSIGMHPVSAALASLRLAPVQAVAWGHPVTTGLPTVDYFLSSELMEPTGAEEHYTETLIRLPGIGVHVAPPSLETFKRSRDDFGLSEETVVFVSPQSLFKYHPKYDHIYPAIAQRVPGSVFVFLEQPSLEVTRTFFRRMEASFIRAGLDPTQHVVLHPRLSRSDFIELNALSDVYLDSPGWSGGMTTLEALSTGVPAVTWPGSFMRGRHTAAFLNRLGLSQLIAPDLDAYVEIATRLGQEPDERSSLRRTILDRVDRLFDDKEGVRSVEAFYERAIEAVVRE